MKVLTAEEIKKQIKNEKLTIVDCFATWCGPCQALKPVLKTAIEAFPDITIVGLDIDEEPDFAKENKVKGVPTMLWYRNGNLVHTTMGVIGKKLLFEKIKQYSE